MKVAQQLGGDQLPHHYAIFECPADSEAQETIDRRLAECHITPLWYPEGEHEYVERMLALLID
jgi:hypothetical protein